MGYSIKVLNGHTLDTIETTMLDHTTDNVMKVAKGYEEKHGKITKLDFNSDCLVIGNYADGMVLGFSI